MGRANAFEDIDYLKNMIKKYKLLFYKIQETENATIIEKLKYSLKLSFKNRNAVDNMRLKNGHKIPSK